MIITCAREGCDVATERKTHNQKYCSDECCRLATNLRIMEKYYAKRDRKRGKTGMCVSCEKTKLSRYNDTNVCSSCRTKKELEANQSALNMLLGASFAI